MLKFICLLTLITFSFSQNAASSLANQVLGSATSGVSSSVSNSVSNALNSGSDIGSSVSNALNNVGISQIESALPLLQGNISNYINVSSLPTLANVTVGYGNESLILTPANPNISNEDWLNSNEEINIERMSIENGENEFILDWSVEDGDNFTLVNETGNLYVIESSSNGTVNNYSLGNNTAFSGQIAQDAQGLINSVYNSNASSVNSSQIRSSAENVIQDTVVTGAVQNFLGQNGASSSLTYLAENALGSAGSGAGTVSSAISNGASGLLQNSINSATIP